MRSGPSHGKLKKQNKQTKKEKDSVCPARYFSREYRGSMYQFVRYNVAEGKRHSHDRVASVAHSPLSLICHIFPLRLKGQPNIYIGFC